MATYTIQVFTGDRQYADTRAKVYLTLNGSYGIQGEIPLEGEFKRGERRTFTVNSSLDLGNLESVHIRHDNTGDEPAWFLQKVVVQNEELKREWIFPCEKWLASDSQLNPDQKIARTLLPAEGSPKEEYNKQQLGGLMGGLRGEYYNFEKNTADVIDTVTAFNSPSVYTRIDPQIFFSPWEGIPYAGQQELPLPVNTEYFAVRWTGKVHAPATGLFKFRVIFDDGVRLWVNNLLQIDHFRWDGTTIVVSSAIKFIKEEWYPIKLEYVQTWGGHYVKLYWGMMQGATDVSDWRLVPSECLSPES